jgi:cell pole-organizing protein PopZ
MTADSAQREPTMEEILASIRRIISEDDKPAEAGADVLELKSNEPVAAEPKAAAPVVPPPAPPPAPKAAAPAPVVPPPPPAPTPTLQEVFAEPAPPESAVQEDIMIVEQEDEPAPVAAAPAPKPAPAPRPHPAFSEDTLVGEPAATKAAGALGKLMGSMMVQSGVTLDDVVKEMLKPMLRDWLDANLPQLVETEVQKEIERIRRMAR